MCLQFLIGRCQVVLHALSDIPKIGPFEALNPRINALELARLGVELVLERLAFRALTVGYLLGFLQGPSFLGEFLLEALRLGLHC